MNEKMISSTTIGSIIGGIGSAVTGFGMFWPPALLIGAGISAIAKVYTGVKTADVEDVEAVAEKLPEAGSGRLIT